MTNNTHENENVHEDIHEKSDSPSIRQAIVKSAMGLAIFAFFTAGIIAITQVATKTNIANNQKAFEAKLLLSILPEDTQTDTLLASAQSFEQLNIDATPLNVKASDVFYQTQSKGEVDAIILPAVAPEGYTEAIRLIIGINKDGEVIGVRVTQHKETPGLGDQVEITKSDWILSFNERSLTAPAAEQWRVKKDGGDFDQLTGATITPRAIVKAIKQSLEFFATHQELLLTPATGSNQI